MSEKRFTYFKVPVGFAKQAIKDNANDEVFDFTLDNVLDKLNEQQELIEELQISDEMGWKRAEHFEKKCPKNSITRRCILKGWSIRCRNSKKRMSD